MLAFKFITRGNFKTCLLIVHVLDTLSYNFPCRTNAEIDIFLTINQARSVLVADFVQLKSVNNKLH